MKTQRRMGLNKVNYFLKFSIILLLLFAIIPSAGVYGFSSISSDSGVTRSRAYTFTIEFREAETTIEPNEEGSVNVVLYNTGNSDDYTLKFVDLHADWSAYFDSGSGLTEKLSVHLDENKNKNIFIYVTAPKSGKITLKVSCTSTTSSEEKIAEMLLEAKKVISISLKDTNNVHNVEAGKSTGFNLEVRNFLDTNELVDFSIQGNPNIKYQTIPDDEKWSVWLDNNSMIIPSNDSANLILTVIAPNSGIPGNSISVFVLASPESTSQEFRSPDLVVRIPEIYNITYTLKQNTPLILPNSTINYTLKLFNVGNIDDIISLRIHENVNNWNVYFFHEDNFFNPSIDSVEIKVNEFSEFLVQIYIPLNAKAKTHSIVYGIYSQKKGAATHINEMQMLVKVRLISDIEIVIPPSGITHVDLQKTSYVEFEVKNMGNGDDTLFVSIPTVSIPFDWEISFHSIKNTKEINATKSVDFTETIVIENIEPLEYIPLVQSNYNNVSLYLNPGQTAYVSLAITAPASGEPGIETFKIYGRSVSDNIDTDTKTMSVKLRVSDLSISTILLNDDEPAPKQDVKISFNVTNNFHLPAKDFAVNLYEINGEFKQKISSRDISVLNPGESEEVTFKWTPKRVNELGYILKVELSGDVIPSDNSTPFRTRNVFVKEKPKSSDSSNQDTLIIVMSVIAVFIVVLLVLLWSMRKRERAQAGKTDSDDRTKPPKPLKPSKPRPPQTDKSSTAKRKSSRTEKN
jgi:uncharacterized membrane protein